MDDKKKLTYSHAGLNLSSLTGTKVTIPLSPSAKKSTLALLPGVEHFGLPKQ